MICFQKAKFGVQKIWVMVLFFALTAPAGIGIAAGILIYMALVDLLAVWA
ncbi:hypothetical protein F2Q69_00058334 [Brassica cretica]|uniref:Uncharacterized protein n=1 Tax=Brassica cretica TaxID=69181 RepID=A0A8S9RMZ3_BRACR|nr:hypothetical protein F2Q69_00058334 [Brassica cretica]